MIPSIQTQHGTAFLMDDDQGRNEIKPVEDMLLDEKGNLRILPYTDYLEIHPDKAIRHDLIRLFCHYHAIYYLPTKEAVEFLNNEIGDTDFAIEVGAGYGYLGRALGITVTDSKIQFDPKVRSVYEAAGQIIIDYPDYVQKMEASEAVFHLKPDVVIAAWTTHKYSDLHGGFPYGMEEEDIVRNCKKYIIIGHDAIHFSKPIFKSSFYDIQKIQEPWILSRRMNYGNAIWICKSKIKKDDK